MRRRARDMATVARLEGDIIIYTRFEERHQVPHGHARASNGGDLSFRFEETFELPYEFFAPGSIEKKDKKRVKAWLGEWTNRHRVYEEWIALRQESLNRREAEKRSEARKKRDSLLYRTGDARWSDRREHHRSLVDAKWVEGYCYELTFSDGKVGVLDMTEDVERHPSWFMDDVIDEPRLFRDAYIDAEEGGGYLCWPNETYDDAHVMGAMYAYERCFRNDGLAFADEWWKQPPYSDFD